MREDAGIGTKRNLDTRGNGTTMALLGNRYDLANLGDKRRPKPVRIRFLESKDVGGWNEGTYPSPS